MCVFIIHTYIQIAFQDHFRRAVELPWKIIIVIIIIIITIIYYIILLYSWF